MKKIYKPKTIITIFVSAFIIVLALFGANWQIGQAETIPTLPIIYTFEPQEICVNSSDTVVTVNGANFIDPTYTQILWLDAYGSYSYIVPDEITDGGTKLIFTVGSDKLSVVYSASFWIDNHPGDLYELLGPLYIEIKGCNYIYLPLIMK